MNRREFLLSSSALVLALSSTFSSIRPVNAAPLEAVIVLSSDETGAPHHDPIRGTVLSVATDLIYDRLIAMSNEHTFHPHLAQSWQESEDGLTWTFQLKQNVRFHDGEPFNADAIVWWISKFEGSANQHVSDAIDRVVVLDEHSVRFEMKRPDPNLLYNLASYFMGIPSPKAYEAAGENFGVTVAVGTGAYKLESFAVGQETVLVANEEYAWGSELSENKGAPAIPRLVLREIQDASTAFLEMNSGGADILLGVPTEFVPQLTANGEVELRNMRATGVSYLQFNSSAAPFSDPVLRQAVALAVDQEPILKAVFSGSGATAHQFLVSSLEESKVKPELLIHNDVAKAKQLLDQAGWKPGADGIRSKDGAALKIKLWSTSETAYKRIAEIVQAQLRDVGFFVDITLYDSASLRDALRQGEYDLVVSHYDWDNADILSWFFSAKNIPHPNSTRWNNPVSEQLREDAENGSRNWRERVAKYTKYQENLLQNFVYVPLHEFEKTIAVNSSRLVVPKEIREVTLGSATLLDTVWQL
ncbi:4-phytase [Ensifer sp. Root31]|uniref:ABC transporter substrate-binding protein n=1 Tax=Ensifer sp. Root31 TaxID=1736512 RepID=UPI0007106E13|nr:ABC transporter substrate-binding protein [Ensifer sp. Root31]KQU86329.1 4-phytase [Ensifer sp. Root31]